MKFQIFVDEPWDYNEKNGTITGKIIHAISKEMALFQSDEPKEFNGCIGNIFRLKARYTDEELDLNKKDEIGIVNGMLYIGDDYTKETNVASLEKHSIYAFIGSLYRIKE